MIAAAAARGKARWTRCRRLNDALAGALGETLYGGVAERLRECHTRFWRMRCSNRHKWCRPYRPCNLRICAFEARSRSLRAVRRYGPVIARLEEARHIVLAMPNVPAGELRRGCAELWRAFARLRRSKIWGWVRGAIAALEVTYRERRREWHPHLHIVVDGPYLPWAWLLEAWRRASGAGPGQSRTCWINRVDSGTVRELLKYVTKAAALARHPDALEEFLSVTHRMRFVRTYGSLYGLNIEEEETGCPDCGSQEIVVESVVTSDDVEWDERGILRPAPWAEEDCPAP
jgi:hypothetical protein